MIPVDGVTFKPGTEEELLPQFHSSFPYVCTCLEFQKDPLQHTPWHWHKAVEIFYIERGQLVYSTPSCEIVFPAGSGGLVNSNILHSAKVYASDSGYRGLYHFFNPSLIAGAAGSRIEKRYVLPMITASHIEMIPLKPDDLEQAEILDLIRDSFKLDMDELGYEFQVRSALDNIWISVLRLIQPKLSERHKADRTSELMKKMLVFLHDHIHEKLSVKDLADVAGISERSCYGIFQKCLHTSPSEYINTYRLNLAYQMLAQTELSITEISQSCGMNNSYFSKVFRQTTGFTPLEYRRFYQRQA